MPRTIVRRSLALAALTGVAGLASLGLAASPASAHTQQTPFGEFCHYPEVIGGQLVDSGFYDMKHLDLYWDHGCWTRP